MPYVSAQCCNVLARILHGAHELRPENEEDLIMELEWKICYFQCQRGLRSRTQQWFALCQRA